MAPPSKTSAAKKAPTKRTPTKKTSTETAEPEETGPEVTGVAAGPPQAAEAVEAAPPEASQETPPASSAPEGAAPLTEAAPAPPKSKKGSRVLLVCPVSGRRHTSPYSLDPEGVFFEQEPDEPPTLPSGWGQLVLERVVPNPEYDATRAQWDLEVETAMGEIHDALKDPEMPAPQRKVLREMVQSGEARRRAYAEVQQLAPLPESRFLVERAVLPVLSPEAFQAAVEALQALGFPLARPAGLEDGGAP